MSERGRWSGEVLSYIKDIETINATETIYLTSYKQLYDEYVHLLGNRRTKLMQIEMNRRNGDISEIYTKELESIDAEISKAKNLLASMEASEPIQNILKRQEPHDIIMEFYKEPNLEKSDSHRKSKSINTRKTFKRIITLEWGDKLLDKISNIPIIGGFLSFLFISSTSLLIFGGTLALIVLFISALIEINFYFGLCFAWILFGTLTYLLGYRWGGSKALFWMYIIFSIIGFVVFSNFEYFI